MRYSESNSSYMITDRPNTFRALFVVWRTQNAYFSYELAHQLLKLSCASNRYLKLIIKFILLECDDFIEGFLEEIQYITYFMAMFQPNSTLVQMFCFDALENVFLLSFIIRIRFGSYRDVIAFILKIHSICSEFFNSVGN